MGHKEKEESKIVSGNTPAKDDEDLRKTKKENKLYGLLKKPDLIGIPQIVKKFSMIEIPPFLGGIKFFNKK